MKRLTHSKHKYVKLHSKELTKLCEFASDLDFEVRFQTTRFMASNDLLGMMSPQLGTIFVDPKQADVVETLAHELGHVIVFSLTGISEEENILDEDLADMIGIALCRALGYKPKTLTRKR